MVKCSTLIMAGVMFTGGLLLGLILHLPGASSPHSRPIRSLHHIEPSDLTETLNYSPDKQQQQQPSVIGVRSLLSKINPQIDINNHQYHKQRPTHLHHRMHNKTRHSRRHFRQRLNNEWPNSRDILLKGKHPNARDYAYLKQNVQHSNQNMGKGKAFIENIQQVSIGRSHHNKNINNSSGYGNEKVLDKYHKKQSDNSRTDTKDTVKRKEISPENDEIELQNTLPKAPTHGSADVFDKLQNTQHVEMSVSVIDVATGSKAALKPAADVIITDRREKVDVNLESQRLTPDNSSNRSLHGYFTQLSEIVDGIYWSPQLERLTPKGFSEIQTTKWRQHVQHSIVKELKEGCGRMQNRLIVFNDGSKMCARYRINTDQIQGEVYSYYLAKVLGIDNVLPPILTTADSTKTQWKSVSNAIDSASWNPNKLFVLTPWLEDLQQAYIPVEFRSDKKHPQTLSPRSKSLVNKTLDELTELVQWSDLIVLDYLTGNVDRVVNNMFNMQWNSGMMHAPTHNLERVGQAGPLVFLDNESGLLHSYRLLDKYNQYHEHLLRSLCLFRKSTADKVKHLFNSGDITQKLKAMFKSSEPLSNNLAFMPQQNLSVLSQRLAHVYRQLISCERHYANNT